MCTTLFLIHLFPILGQFLCAATSSCRLTDASGPAKTSTGGYGSPRVRRLRPWSGWECSIGDTPVRETSTGSTPGFAPVTSFSRFTDRISPNTEEPVRFAGIG